MKLIERESYLQRLKNLIDTPDIKVITGIRRCGKSKLMDAFSEHLLSLEDSNVIRINLNLKEYEKLLDKENLYTYVEEKYKKDKKNFVLIDEIQLCNGFERIITSLHAEEKYDIYLTGSNAFLLSSDLATLFGGRVFEIKVYPFSFKEFLLYYPSKDIDASFDEYLYKGGMAGSYLYRNEEDQKQYIQEVYQSTVLKDIILKYKVENEDLLKKLADFLMDSVGSIASYRKLARSITSNTYKVNDKTIASYLDYLSRSFVFYGIRRYDIKGKRYLESSNKYFLADLSFRFAELGNKNIDYGHLYENIVAIELLRRGYEVYVGCLYNKEIDFVAIKNGVKTYIQVSDDISKEETFERETNPLLSIKDAYPKIIIARTKHPESQYEGIRIIDIARWLTEETK